MFEILEHLLNKAILHLSQGPCYYMKIKICKKVLFFKTENRANIGQKMRLG